jgi:hypothetical protein
MVIHLFLPNPFFAIYLNFKKKQKQIHSSIFFANAIEFLQIQTPSLNPMN